MSKIIVNVPLTGTIEIDSEDLQFDDYIVAVVRCKDCRHWWLPYGAECMGVCQLWDMHTDYDFFCKDGERRSE